MIDLLITHIIDETPESRTFCFKATKEALSYKAGQFITIILHFKNSEQRRSYSLSSAPGVDGQPCITVKRIQNGAISRYLFSHLKTGDVIQALPPAGRFTIQQQSELYFFVAAGSGITPVFSQVKHLLYKQPSCKVVLLYQNRNEKQSIFRKKLLEFTQSFPGRFQLVELFSQPEHHSNQPQRLNNYLLEKIVLKYVHTASVQFFICGPKAFMLVIKFTLRLMGYTEEQIFKENFVIDQVPPPPAQLAHSATRQVIIRLHNETYKIPVTYPQNILQAALYNNVQLPFSCRGGQCSTCVARCLSGSVVMSINEVLTSQDINRGLVLTCVSYPQTDVLLTFDQEN